MHLLSTSREYSQSVFPQKKKKHDTAKAAGRNESQKAALEERKT